MPTNLDALIRYKTLDQCFASGRRYTLDELAERCSEALSEKSGNTRSVSTRTIQDDIRVMRSELLAFKAPIKVKDSLYFYAKPGEYVFSKSINGKEELKAIMELLIKILMETKNQELFYVIRKLDRITEAGISDLLWNELGFKYEEHVMLRINTAPASCKHDNTKPVLTANEPEPVIEPRILFCWEEVIKVLGH